MFVGICFYVVRYIKTHTEDLMKNYFENPNALYIAKLRPDAIVPTKRDEDAGYDIYANFEGDTFVIPSLTTIPVPTGIAMACSSDYYVQVEERGSTGKIGLKKSAGVMDSGYRGEYFILLTNANKQDIVLSKKSVEELGKTFVSNGKKYKTKNCIVYPYSKAIAQLVVLPLPKMQSAEISYEELKNIPSLRGDGKYGSSKK